MTEEFVLDMNVIKKKGKLTSFKNRRIKFENDSIQFHGPNRGESPRTYHCSEILYKPLKLVQGSLKVVINLQQNAAEEIALHLLFTKPFEQWIEWVISCFNTFIEENKDRMKAVKSKPFVPLDSRNSSRQDNQKQQVNCRDRDYPEFQRQKSSEMPRMKQSQPMAVRDSSKNGEGISSCNIVTSEPAPQASRREQSIAASAVSKSSGSEIKHPEKSFMDQLKSCSEPFHFEDDTTKIKRPSSGSPGIQKKVTPTSPVFSSLEKETARAQDNVLPPTISSTSPSITDCASILPKGLDLSDTKDSPLPSSSDDYSNRRLVNTGNSCYFNATMQALSACPQFVAICRQLRRCLKKPDSNRFKNANGKGMNDKFVLLNGLLKMMHKLSTRLDPFPGNKPISHSSLLDSELTNIRLQIGKILPDFDNNQQQDASEYLTNLLGSLDDLMEVNQEFVKSGSLYEQSVAVLNPRAAFSCGVEFTYICTKCRHRSSNKDTLLDLALPVSDPESSVQDLLGHFDEWLTVEKNCNRCGHKFAFCNERIYKFPQCLIVSLKIYEVDGSGCSTIKKPFNLLSPFRLDASQLEFFASETKLDEDKKESFSSSDFNEDNSNQNDVPPLAKGHVKLLGGNYVVEGCSHSQDVIVDDVKDTKIFDFKLLSDFTEVQNILQRLKIDHDINSLKSHLKVLSRMKEMKMQKADVPSGKIEIQPDGNCFYRAISWCLTGTQKYHRKLREQTVKYLKDNETVLKKYCDKDYNTFVTDVNRDKEWSVSCEIFAVARMLNVEIFTFLGESGWMSHPPIKTDTYRTGCIYLNNTSNHFEPALTLNGSTEYMDNGIDETTEIESEKEAPRDCKSSGEIENKDGKNELSMGEPVNEQSSEKAESVSYLLIAVICHVGTTPHRGHYIAYTRDLYKEDEWICCDDSCIYRVTEDVVREEVHKTGYVLFYDRE